MVSKGYRRALDPVSSLPQIAVGWSGEFTSIEMRHGFGTTAAVWPAAMRGVDHAERQGISA
jgi:hypothetical protein